MVQTKGSKSLLASDNQKPRPQDSGRDMAEGIFVGQVPQTLSPGKELLQMCAHAPNAGDPWCTSGSCPQPVLGFHTVPGAAEHWELLQGHPMLQDWHPKNSGEVL